MAYDCVPPRALQRKSDSKVWWCCLSVALLVLVSTSSAGETLFKCEQSNGVPSFQSAPCAAGSREVWAREIQAEAEVTQPAVPSSRPSRQGRSRQTVAAGWSRHASGRDQCAAAREAAADERDRRWREVTMDDLRRLDDQVQRACRRR